MIHVEVSAHLFAYFVEQRVAGVRVRFGELYVRVRDGRVDGADRNLFRRGLVFQNEGDGGGYGHNPRILLGDRRYFVA